MRMRRIIQRTQIIAPFLFVLITTCCLFIPNAGYAGVNLPWSTSYDCDNWSNYSQSLSCDGLDKGGAWTTSDGKSEQITSNANNPSGGGGKGQRHWLGPGTNNNSGGLKVNFNTPQTEIWMRWYARWEPGFQGNFDQYKMLYIYGANGGSGVFQPAYGNIEDIRFWTGVDNAKCTDCGWGTTFYTDGTSDGSWVLFEIHINLETNRNQLWINEELVMDVTQSWNISGGIGQILIGSNCKNVSNSRTMYVDYDDIMIYHATPPNSDVHGNPFIGPLGDGTEKPAPPTGLQIH